MLRDQVCTLDLQGRVEMVFEIDEPSGLGFLADGRVLVVCRGSGSLLVGKPGEGTTTLSALAEQGVVGVNDSVTDLDGRTYVGSLGAKYQLGDEDRSWSEPAPGKLLCIQPNGDWTVAAQDLASPNGMVITPDGAKLIVAETYRFHAKVESGFPDGLALDADGAVWVGAGEEFARVDTRGAVVQRVPVPGWRCIACALGGTDRRTLFLAVAQMSMEEFLNRQSLGRILAVHVDSPGAGLP
jgi:sugar lactone lactonase YvrE